MDAPYAERARDKYDALNSRPRFPGNRFLDALPEIHQQLESAIAMGDVLWVKDCVRKGADVNCRLDQKGSTPLMMATEAGWVHIIRFLVENTQVDLELTDSGGYNAADLAAMHGYVSAEEKGRNADVADIVNYLKEHGLEYTWRGAIIGGDIDRINEFLENGQDIEDRTGYPCEGDYQMTGFQTAIKFGRYSVARYLLVLGAVIPRDVCQMQLPLESDMRAYT
jgi:ankyrin repeat protein